ARAARRAVPRRLVQRGEVAIQSDGLGVEDVEGIEVVQESTPLAHTGALPARCSSHARSAAYDPPAPYPGLPGRVARGPLPGPLRPRRGRLGPVKGHAGALARRGPVTGHGWRAARRTGWGAGGGRHADGGRGEGAQQQGQDDAHAQHRQSDHHQPVRADLTLQFARAHPAGELRIFFDQIGFDVAENSSLSPGQRHAIPLLVLLVPETSAVTVRLPPGKWPNLSGRVCCTKQRATRAKESVTPQDDLNL